MTWSRNDFNMRYRPSRNVLVLGFTSLFNDLSSEMILAVFPAFFVSVLKAGASSLGFVEGLAEGTSNVIKIYAGRLSDRTQKRKSFILFGYSVSVVARPLYILAANVGGVAGLRVADRVGKGLRDSPLDAVLSLSTPREELGRAFGFHRALDTLGAIVGPLVAYLILRAYPTGFHIVFLTAFFAGIVAVLTVLFIKEIPGEARRKTISLSSLAAFSANFKRYLIALLFLSLGSLPVAVLLLKAQSIGLTLSSIPLFYLLYNLSCAGFSFSAGKMSDRVGSKKVIAAGYGVLIVSYLCLTFAEDTTELIISVLVLGLFPAFTDGMQRALASELSTANLRGSALGYVNAISGIGLLLAGVGGGYRWQHLGIGYALALAGLLAVIGVGILTTVSEVNSGGCVDA
jgi:MFS family permease